MKITLLFPIASLLAMAACTATTQLLPISDRTPIKGTITRGIIEPHLVEITLEGKNFRGEWRTGPPSVEQRKATTYPHRYHIGEVRSTLIAADNSRLDCIWRVHGTTGEGACTGSDGREHPLRLK